MKEKRLQMKKKERRRNCLKWKKKKEKNLKEYKKIIILFWKAINMIKLESRFEGIFLAEFLLFLVGVC